jgi:hypothetical protein
LEKKKKGFVNVITSFGRQGSPASMAMLFNISQELLVFFRRPWPFLQSHLITALRPYHLSDLSNLGQLREKDVRSMIYNMEGKCEEGGGASELEKRMHNI